ncbi:DUF551 domain-containing protein [Flavihumibacter sp. R14]|nr:DUF551 domain-containing protein [Flavihumibacter soli]
MKTLQVPNNGTDAPDTPFAIYHQSCVISFFPRRNRLITLSLTTFSMEWISITQTLPEELKEILIFDRLEGINIAYYFKETNSYIVAIDGSRLTNVGYWMPLPESPGGEL